jgi:hypothetical protein
LQRDDLAASVATGGDAVGHRTHPQPIHAVVATRAVGQEHGFVFAFEPAAARQVPAHAMRDGVGELRQLRRGGGTGAAQARLAPRGLDVRVVHAVEPQQTAVGAIPDASPVMQAKYTTFRQVLGEGMSASELFSGMGATISEKGVLGCREVMVKNGDSKFALNDDNHVMTPLGKLEQKDLDQLI